MWKTASPPASRDLNDCPVGTIIWINDSAGIFTHVPVGSNAFHVFTYESVSGYKIQLAYVYTGNFWYMRTCVDGAWRNWVAQPTRTEVDALNNRHTISAVGTATTFTVPSGYRGVLYVTDSSPDRCGEYAVYCTGAGAVGYRTLSEAAGITIDTSTANKLTLTTASGTRTCMFLNVDKVITV